jgi:3'-5' exoribonuclease
VGVPRDLETHVVHLVLAHHGRLEYGSPKTPMTLEALLTHEIDELDSRVNSWLNLMGREGGTRRWTDSNNVYEQHIWRGTLPTAQVEKKGPPPEAMAPVIYVPREGAPHQRPGGQQQQQKKRPRPQQERRAEPPPKTTEGAAAASAPADAAAAEGAPAPAPRPERHERPPRPDRHERPDRGGFRGGPGGPGDRKRGYTGPRLPGDKGPQARPKPPGALTHNPFAALANKIEGGEPAAHPEASVEAQPQASSGSAPAPEPQPAAAPEAAATGERTAAPETTATPGVAETPPAGEAPAAGGNERQ